MIEIGVSKRWGLVELVESIFALIKHLAESGPFRLVEPFVLRGTFVSDALTSLNAFIVPDLAPLLPRQVHKSPLLH